MTLLQRFSSSVAPPVALPPTWQAASRNVSNAFSRPTVDVGIAVGSGAVRAVRRRGGTISQAAALKQEGSRVVPVSELSAQKLGTFITRPISGGRVLHREHAVIMMRHLLRRTGEISPSVVLAVLHELTVTERRRLEQVAMAAGANRVYTVDEALMAALGAGLDLLQPEATLTIDIGACGTRVSITAMGKVVVSRVLPVGGNDMDGAVRAWLGRNRGLVVSPDVARQV
ncbi:MAG: rod shape-determining protein, partial [Candidatus Xenobia bacterium]